jgi:hypothetical protein
MNTEGLSYPGIRCRSASFRRYFLDASFLPRVQEPAAIRLRHRVLQTPSLIKTIAFLKSIIEEPYEKDAVE